jgi:hypothetical protein
VFSFASKRRFFTNFTSNKEWSFRTYNVQRGHNAIVFAQLGQSLLDVNVQSPPLANSPDTRETRNPWLSRIVVRTFTWSQWHNAKINRVAGSAPLLAAINRNIVKLLELNGFTVETVDNQK